jgi:hypothetical protein
MMLELSGCWMNRNNLLEEIEQLRQEMERRGRVEPLNSKELLRLSERLDRLINAYLLRSGKRDVRNANK